MIEDHDQHWHEDDRETERKFRFIVTFFLASIFLCSVAILMIAWRMG